MIHSKLFSILVATAAVALGALVAGCALEGGEPGDVSSQTSELRVSESPNKVLDVAAVPVQPNAVVQSPKQIAPVVREDHVLGTGSGNDEGPRPHPWMPAPDDGTNTNTGSSPSSDTPDNKSSK